jgi:hypothetical protein
MKKVFSITFTLLMSVALIHFSVSVHYCGGKEVASLLSLSGKTISCGMTEHAKIPVSTGTFFNSECCSDIVNFYATGTNFYPSFHSINKVYFTLSEVFTGPNSESFQNYDNLKIAYSGFRPPGSPAFNSRTLPLNCTFRI